MFHRIKKDILSIVALSFLLATSEFLGQFYLNFQPAYSLISRIPGLMVYNFVLHICLVGLLFLIVSIGIMVLGGPVKRFLPERSPNPRIVKISLIVFAFLFLYYWNLILINLSQIKYLLYCFLFMAVSGIIFYIIYKKLSRFVKKFIYGYSGLLLLVSGALIIWAIQVSSQGEIFDRDYASGSPNIIYIVIDTLRPDALSCYGDKAVTTPHIDALASDGILFENTFSSSSWTIPGTTTLLTAQQPSSLNMFSVSSILPERAVSISEVLKRDRYITAAIIGNPLVNEKSGFNQGIDYFDCWANEFYVRFAGVRLIDLIIKNTLNWKNIKYMKEYQEFFPVLDFSKPQFIYFKRTDYRRGEEITHQALGLIEKMLPYSFFLYLHYLDPHEPYLEHPYEFLPYIELPTKERREKAVKRYLGEVEYADEQVGNLISELKAKGVYKNTIIILTADHGEQFYEHDELGHAKALYNEELKIPLIIKGIDNKGGIRVNDPISAVDILPTIFNMLDINMPTSFEGRSLKSPTYKIDLPAKNNILAELILPLNFTTDAKYYFSLLDNDFKYIITLSNEFKIEKEELYNLKLDKEEKSNIAAEFAEHITAYREIVLEKYNKLPTALNNQKRLEDKRQLDLLKSLGYI